MKKLKDLLGEHKDYFRRGLICESQGYGIAAFAYYRRIVEETIDLLLQQISDLMSEDNEKGNMRELLKKRRPLGRLRRKLIL